MLPALADTRHAEPMNDRAKRGQCEVLRLRNLAMIENIRRAEDPAWGERLERQQVLARLGRMFGRAEDPLQALQDHVQAVKEELQTRRSAPRTPPPDHGPLVRRS